MKHFRMQWSFGGSLGEGEGGCVDWNISNIARMGEVEASLAHVLEVVVGVSAGAGDAGRERFEVQF
nr:hypothetical protein [Williamsia limnetica]